MIGDLVATIVAALFSGGIAAFVALRRERSIANTSFALGMLAIAATETCAALAAQTSIPSQVLFWKRLELGTQAILPGAWLVFCLTFARSDATAVLDRHRRLIAAAFVAPLALAMIFHGALFAVPNDPDRTMGTLLPLGWSGAGFHLVYLLLSVVILAALETTLRATRGGKRWRVKFMLIGIGSFFAARVYLCTETLLYSSIDPLIRPFGSWATLLACALMTISIARTRETMVELRLSKAIVYNSVAVLLVGIYLIAVGLMGGLLNLMGGGARYPWTLVAVFALLVGGVVFLFSDQLREELRRAIAQNFYAPSYDYRKEWTSFSRETASLVDAEELSSAVCEIVSRTFGVDSVTIWRVTDGGEQVTVEGSTALSSGEMRSRPDFQLAALALVRSLKDRTEIVELEELVGADAEALRSSREFVRLARIRTCVPLVAARTFVGVMTLGERITGEPFTLEDYDLLRTLADQAAANVLNLHLAERVAAAKEMEAFQTLSAFFVHDLKNLASMLSLTVQNLPKNYDNPEFRNDALKTISQSVEKMNAMSGELSLLSRKLDLHLRESDLNELTRQILDRTNGSLRVLPQVTLQPLPVVSVDRDQLEKVLTNLLLNADDALDGEGELRVSTEARDGWVVLTVADTGRGMSEDFVSKRLFRPFQTTKSRGLGIGLFQSKRLVEAHGGRIEAESQLGVGSSFRVLLPPATLRG